MAVATDAAAHMCVCVCVHACVHVCAHVCAHMSVCTCMCARAQITYMHSTDLLLSKG